MEIINSLDNWAKGYGYEVGMEACPGDSPGLGQDGCAKRLSSLPLN